MMKRNLHSAIVALGVFIAAPAALAADAAGDAAKGQQVFMALHCYVCHGTQGNGGAANYPKLAPNPLPVEGIQAEMRNPRQAMPRYTPSMVSDQDIADIHAYLASIPESPKAADIPLLNQ
jgi:mono/diheme cytochrome c family protein